MILVTGATGRLGNHVLEGLLEKVPPEQVAVAVRDPAKASHLASRGVQVRQADYDRPEMLGPALRGVEKVLLISSGELGRRVQQHQAVADASRRAEVRLLAFTSMLHADTAHTSSAAEYWAAEVSRQTGRSIVYQDLSSEQYEAALVGAGVPALYAQEFAAADMGISRGELFEGGGALRRLIGRPTTPLADAVAAALSR